MDYSSSDDSDDSDSDSPEITPQEGLSAGALEALLSFQETGSCFADDEEEGAANISKDTVCVAYTANDSAVIAATLRRLKEKENGGGAKENKDQAVVIEDLQAPGDSLLLETLQRDGVVRVNQVLSSDLCDQCMDHITTKLASTDEDSSIQDGDADTDNTSNGYGNVFSRKNRYDMYLRPSGVSQEALRAMLSRDSPLGQLFHDMLPSAQGGIFHEFSSLISDPGADRQPLHPDAPYAEHAPLWTVFCALQDVEFDMGPTVFLLGSHSAETHDALINNDTSRMTGSDANYRRSVLRKGDAAVMDARTLHYGGANNSLKRRVLLYFTIRNPVHGSCAEDFPKCGSLWPDLEVMQMTNLDYY